MENRANLSKRRLLNPLSNMLSIKRRYCARILKHISLFKCLSMDADKAEKESNDKVLRSENIFIYITVNPCPAEPGYTLPLQTL